MEITEQQFTANLEQMPEQQQVQVVQLIEQNDSEILQSFAASLGVNLSMGEEEAPLDSSEEVGGEPPLLPRERNLQEMQEFDNRTDPDPDPDPDLSDPAAFPGQVTAPGAMEIKVSPVEDQMQQLAFGDQVAGPIEQPGAENETGVADDVPMDAPEGAFIINASAIAKVGRLDFEQRILAPAIKELKKEGVNIELASLKTPSKQVDGAVDIAVSNKEYYIPPELAEMIGTDLLEKINKRGEKETEKKLAEQPPQQEVAPAGQNQIPVRGAKGLEVPQPKGKPSVPSSASVKELNATSKLFTGIESFLIKEEGYEPKARRPTPNDRWTVGHGHTEGVKPGDRMGEAEARAALGKDIRKRLPEIRKEISVFDSLPVELQVPIFGEYFRGSLTSNKKNGSPKTLRLIKEGNFEQAGDELLNRDEYRKAVENGRKGIIARMDKASEAIKSIGTYIYDEQDASSPTRFSPISEAELQKLEKGLDTETYLTKQQPPVN